MANNRWRQISELYDAALAKPPENRAAFLAAACSDEELRGEVTSLLEQTAATTELPSRQIGSYRILSLLGAGGMGAVYLADDTRLRRKVALKVLHSTSAGEDTNRRLLHEARTAAALDHPNICAIFEAGEADGHSFIAMQFVEGETLASRLSRGPLPVAEAMLTAVEVAGALAEAHRHGVVHRDIKPQNIVISTRGDAKVLDFGIAKRMAVVGSPVQTATVAPTGWLAGTAAYMSPEQARAEELDGRTDIFSFGIVLCEMFTGRHPFERSTPADTLAAIIGAVPRVDPIRDPRGPELERIVRKCLERDKTLRYQSALELLTDLRRLNQTQIQDVAAGVRRSRRFLILTGGGVALALVVAGTGLYRRSASTGPAFRSVAVLPFVNVDLGSNLDYQVDGVTDSIIGTLSRLSPDLTVISHAAVFSYRGRTLDPRSVASELDVEALVMGRAFRSGDSITISVEIVDARDNSRLWGEQYQQGSIQALLAQDEIPRAVSEKLRPQVRTADLSAGNARTNSEIYQLYLQGRFYWHLWTQDGARRAVELFQQAIDIDPNYALAYSGIAEAHMVPGTGLPQRESHARARAAAMKALALDPTLSEAHASLASVLLAEDWDIAGAEREFKRALELNPNNIEGHHQYAHYLLTVGRVEQATVEVQRVLALDPISLLPITHLAYHNSYTRQYDEALRHHARYIAAYPTEPSSHKQKGDVYYHKGMFAEAFDSYLTFHRLNGASSVELDTLKKAFASDGIRGYFVKRIEQLQAHGQPEPHMFPIQSLGTQIASLYARLGDRDRAFEWLEKDFAQRGEGLIHLREEILFDNLRPDPRFADLLRRIGLPPL